VLGVDILLDQVKVRVRVRVSVNPNPNPNPDPNPDPNPNPNQDLRPWLLEVNHNPSLTCDTPFDHALKSGEG